MHVNNVLFCGTVWQKAQLDLWNDADLLCKHGKTSWRWNNKTANSSVPKISLLYEQTER